MAQFVHVDSPTVAPYWPLGQAKHMVDPAVEAKEPGAQEVHEGAACEDILPGVQLLQADDPEYAYKPDAQKEHVDGMAAATAEEYMPAAQFTQL
jgi:hypothetical protein